jgi:hypothetical protein
MWGLKTYIFARSWRRQVSKVRSSISIAPRSEKKDVSESSSLMAFQGLGNVKVTYEVSVADLQRLVDTIANLTRSGLPGTVSQLTETDSLAELRCSDIRGAYGILWPVLSVTVFPEDILKKVYDLEGKK